MSSLFFPALVAGIFCSLGAIESPWAFGMSGGFYILGRPLVAGLIMGIAFGDVRAGVLCGVAVQGVFIANLQTGGTTNSEITYAGYGGIGLAMATGGNAAIAVTLSILIGQTFGLIFYNTRMAAYSYWNNRAQKSAENLDYKGIVFNHLIGPAFTTFAIRAIPVFLAIFYGKPLVDGLLQNTPDTIIRIISILGGVLPALGIAMLMNIVIKEKIHFIFYILGFILITFAKLPMIPIVFISILIAYIVYLSSGNKGTVSEPKKVIDSDYYEDEDLF